jgi:hypothetical protein
MKSKIETWTNSIEFLGFHGCRSSFASESIKLKGFDIKFAKAGMYGTGLYFAINSSYSVNCYDC